jgi:hypothetical protein
MPYFDDDMLDYYDDYECDDGADYFGVEGTASVIYLYRVNESGPIRAELESLL